MVKEELFFKNEKEELEFYREYKNRKSFEISDEIHKLLGIYSEEYNKRLYLLQIGKKELILLKNAIKNKLKDLK